MKASELFLEAPAGSGKNNHARSIRAPAFYLPEDSRFSWICPNGSVRTVNILPYIAEHPAFGARDLDASLLAKLRGKHPPTFLLNGWNEGVTRQCGRG